MGWDRGLFAGKEIAATVMKLFKAIYLVYLVSVVAGRAEVAFPSPDGRFGILIKYDSQGDDIAEAELVEIPSKKVIAKVDECFIGSKSDLRALWSKDGKRVAIYGRSNRVADTRIYYLIPHATFFDASTIKIPELENLEFIRWVFDDIAPVKWLDGQTLLLRKKGRIQVESQQTNARWMDYDYDVMLAFNGGKPELIRLRKKGFFFSLLMVVNRHRTVF